MKLVGGKMVSEYYPIDAVSRPYTRTAAWNSVIDNRVHPVTFLQVKTCKGPFFWDQFVYAAAEALDGPTVKIGWTRDPDQRLRELSRLAQAPMQYFAVCPGNLQHERFLHCALQHLLHTGEWYAPCDEVRDVLTALRRSETPWLDLGRRYRAAWVETFDTEPV